MAFQTWQVGLDIQNTQLCALAIQRRRGGWQLCRWWQQGLPQDTLRNGVLQSSPELQAALRMLQQQLPQRYSLRVGLPAQLVLQRPLALPSQRLQEPALGRYVTAAAQRLFPVEPEALALDYRASEAGRQLYVTAARQEVIAQWLTPLRQSALRPAVFELTTHALALAARAAGLKDDAALLIGHDAHWLWYSRASESVVGSASLETAPEEVRQRCFPQASTLYGCAPSPDLLPDAFFSFSPFSLFAYRQPPLPQQEAAFCIAAGLALRPEDS
ncbi:MAG: pilus assembly protein PilM [Pantoea sp.]|jgi:pilus assembly protein HofM|uniref:pilus assembly protein PilM n=1 Tax=Pantoea TaxID=53335 RepID=UPI000ECDDE3C|nr:MULTISPECIES: pilus assembly protein PilM [Pantoea]MDU1575666.1 pilus assembly protein PilM [Pantoea sp.]MDU5475532.1 pilus assembly protein PilM [Pantoea sp.]MDU6078838.1 pilus assembly protein PilM [Pantoea sp.]MDU7839903.1 pilus assembly protein PilM [Pantoea sp.]HAB73685.1 pilus assembly protein HofM [Pantoea sp.]